MGSFSGWAAPFASRMGELASQLGLEEFAGELSRAAGGRCAHASGAFRKLVAILRFNFLQAVIGADLLDANAEGALQLEKLGALIGCDQS